MSLFTRARVCFPVCIYERAYTERRDPSQGASSVLYVQSAFCTNNRGVRYCPSDDERLAELLPAGASSTARY